MYCAARLSMAISDTPRALSRAHELEVGYRLRKPICMHTHLWRPASRGSGCSLGKLPSAAALVTLICIGSARNSESPTSALTRIDEVRETDLQVLFWCETPTVLDEL